MWISRKERFNNHALGYKIVHHKNEFVSKEMDYMMHGGFSYLITYMY